MPNAKASTKVFEIVKAILADVSIVRVRQVGGNAEGIVWIAQAKSTEMKIRYFSLVCAIL
jgi:hypothetical protein